MAKIIIGTRSALFLPFCNLGIIVIDEEHDSSYKQETYPIYHAKDMAISLCYFCDIPILLISATLSITTLHNIQINNSNYIYFKISKKFFDSPPLSVEIIDMQKEHNLLSAQVHNTIAATILQEQQVLIYINRRGYAAVSFCLSCKNKIECPNCSVSLTTYRSLQQMLCHYCNYKTEMLHRCNKCQSLLKHFGFGVEQLQSEIIKFHPNAKVFVASSDTIQSEQDMQQLTEQINNNQKNVIVSTQILAKGHHFPKVTVVVAAAIDISFTDFGFLEKLYQTVYQMSCRAGREESAGMVLVQTTNPTSPIVLALKNSLETNTQTKHIHKFIEYEMQIRKKAQLSPYCKMAFVVFGSSHETIIKEYVHIVVLACIMKVRQMYNAKSIVILGPAQCQIYKIKNRFCWNILIKANSVDILHNFLRSLQNILCFVHNKNNNHPTNNKKSIKALYNDINSRQIPSNHQASDIWNDALKIIANIDNTCAFFKEQQKLSEIKTITNLRQKSYIVSFDNDEIDFASKIKLYDITMSIDVDPVQSY